jgi:3'-5' exonuclease
MANREKGERQDRTAAQPARPKERTAPLSQSAPRLPRPPATYEDIGYRGPVALPASAPTWRQRRYVERPAELAAAVARLRQAHVLALDAEFSQVRVRTPEEPAHRLSLLQVAADDEYDTAYVIDALRLRDLTPLQPVFDDLAVLKLFHGIGADARVLAARGLVARTTLDLEAVSRSIFGQRESGLQAMVQRACGIRLDKSLQRADWSRRPLTPAMIAYAARDAEVTFVLYGWLTLHYPWAVALHETRGDEPPPVADWIIPYLEGARPKPAAFAVAEAGIAADAGAQEEALRTALAIVRHPNQRARVMRLITDLELVRLAPDLRPYLAAPASEERAGAARGIGRLHDKGAIMLIRPLQEDPVEDVRRAARLALEALAGSAPPRRPRTAPAQQQPAGPLRWTSEADEDTAPPEDGWRAALRASFGLPAAQERSGDAPQVPDPARDATRDSDE